MKKKLSVLIFIIIVVFGFVVEKTDFSENKREYYGDWQLVLVNYNNKVPANWESELVTLSCGEKVDKRIYPHLKEMFDEAKKDGIELIVRSGYRSEKEQEQIMQKKIEAYMSEGNNKIEAEILAENWVSKPGESEHQLGIAVDINGGESTPNERAYEWLEKNAWKYGFIKRYPQEKTHITKIGGEKWHYRYVGEYAKEITKTGVCLEEALESCNQK